MMRKLKLKIDALLLIWITALVMLIIMCIMAEQQHEACEYTGGHIEQRDCVVVPSYMSCGDGCSTIISTPICNFVCVKHESP